MRVLIAEDDPTSLLLLTKLLEPYGEPVTAVDGEKALAAFRQALEDDRPFDLVCLDVMMPGMDGHEVLEAIREAEAKIGLLLGRGVRVLMTTAIGDSESVMRAYRGRCDAYLVKPVDRAKLIQQLESFGFA